MSRSSKKTKTTTTTTTTKNKNKKHISKENISAHNVTYAEKCV